MKNYLSFLTGCLLVAGTVPAWGQDTPPELVIRIDDMGAFHSVNKASVATYRDGIAKSVEVMPVAAWFPEAVLALDADQRMGEREMAPADPLSQPDG